MEDINTDSELALVNKKPEQEPEEQVTEPEIEPVVAKAKRGRPRKYEEGAKMHEKVIKYSSQYYREHKDKKIECQFCKKEIVYIYKSQHYKSRVCQFMRTYKTHKDSENLVDELTKVFIK
jgi:hypothetical protein